MGDDVETTDDVLAGQIGYYRRRAAEYDVTAYGDLEAANARITRLVAQLGPTGDLLEIACGTGLWTQALAGPADLVERRLNDRSTHRIVKRFVDPEVLAAELDRLGWDCTIERDGPDWVYGQARPGRRA